MLLQLVLPSTPVVNVVPTVGLPLWTQLLTLAITITLAVLRLVEFFRRGTLEVRLTRDSFFRLTDVGEALFVHAALLTREGPVLIDDVSVTLRRLPRFNARTAEKSFPLEIVNHGEKVQGAALNAEHRFSGASPLLYVGAASTQRPVYMCVHAEYKDRQRQAWTDFDQDLFGCKREVGEAVTNGNPKPLADVPNVIEARVRPHYASMCGMVQLEAGDYELVLRIRYEKIGMWVWKRQRSVDSYGYFVVDETGLKAYNDQLLNALYARASNIVNGTNENIRYPEYQPKHFNEAKKRHRD